MKRRISVLPVKRTLFINLYLRISQITNVGHLAFYRHRRRRLVCASVYKQARNDVDAQGEDHRIEGKGEDAVK